MYGRAGPAVPSLRHADRDRTSRRAGHLLVPHLPALSSPSPPKWHSSSGIARYPQPRVRSRRRRAKDCRRRRHSIRAWGTSSSEQRPSRTASSPATNCSAGIGRSTGMCTRREDRQLTLHDRTVGAWLWSGREGIVTGLAAAALHGPCWIDDDVDIELVHTYARSPRGIVTRNERDRARRVARRSRTLPVATSSRTAFDLGRFRRRGDAVAPSRRAHACAGRTH